MTVDLRDLAGAPTEADLRQAEAAAQARSHGLADAEARKRARLALELAAALREPLIPGSAPHDLDAIAALMPRLGRAR